MICGSRFLPKTSDVKLQPGPTCCSVWRTWILGSGHWQVNFDDSIFANFEIPPLFLTEILTLSTKPILRLRLYSKLHTSSSWNLPCFVYRSRSQRQYCYKWATSWGLSCWAGFLAWSCATPAVKSLVTSPSLGWCQQVKINVYQYCLPSANNLKSPSLLLLTCASHCHNI